MVLYIRPQERQMLSLSTTSTFEYPYLDTMRQSTKGRYFGGQDGCIILAAKTDCDWPFTRLMLWEVAFNQSYQLKFWFISGHSCVPIWSIKIRHHFDCERTAKSTLIDSQTRSSIDFSLLIFSLIYNLTFQILLNWFCVFTKAWMQHFRWIYICCRWELPESNFSMDWIVPSLQKVKRSIPGYDVEFNLNSTSFCKVKAAWLHLISSFSSSLNWVWPGQVILGHTEYN